MAQFDFLSTPEDSWNLLLAIADAVETKVVVDKHYEEQVAPAFAVQSDAAREAVLSRRKLLLVGAYTHHALAFGSLELAEGRRYYVDVVVGPCIEYTPAACYLQEGKYHLNTGMIAHQREYRSPHSNVIEKPGAALTGAYRRMVRTAKSFLREDLQYGMWIGPEVQALLRAGDAVVEALGRKTIVGALGRKK